MLEAPVLEADAEALAAGAEVVGAAVDAAGEAGALVEAGGVEDVVLDPEEQAASAAQPAVTATARSVLVERAFIRAGLLKIWMGVGAQSSNTRH
jgi:hypothetical protein